MKEKSGNNYDVIVIGSGLSGMASAGLLTKVNKKKVLVLERHFEIGGLTHEFKRGAYSWDIGLHYLGNMNKRLMDFMGKVLLDFLTEGKLKWNQMPKVFDKFVFPDFKIEVEAGVKGYKNALLKEFPEEKKSINKYVRDIHIVRLWYLVDFFSKIFHFPLKQLFQFLSLFNKKKALMLTSEYMNKNIKNKKLQAALQARWGNYGVIPQKSAFAIHAVIEHHYYTGGVFPDGGAEKIASLLENSIELYGGKILISREVTQIILKDKKAVGVRVKNLASPETGFSEYYAPCIISACGADRTYLELIPQSLDLKIQKELKNYPEGLSGLNIYIGLKDSPEKLGIKGENFWIFDGYEDNLITEKHLNPDNLKSSFCFVSFPSMKSGKPGAHTADIVTILPHKLFEEWKGEGWKKRKNNYYKLKEKIIENTILLVEKYIPGFSDLVVYKEAATPLTLEHFTNRKDGIFYGIPAYPQRYKLSGLGVKTPIKGLYLTGSDILCNGIFPALISAMGTVSYINGPFGIMELFSKAFNERPKYQKKNKLSNMVYNESEDKATAVLIKKEKSAAHLTELTFHFNRDLKFIPGQHIKLYVGKNEWRAYSVAKTEDNNLTLVIDTRPGGTGAKYVNDLNIGEKSLFRMPITDLVYHTTERSLFFIATGTGLMPFIHMMDELKKAGVKKKIIMLFGCMNEKEDITENYLSGYKKYFNMEVNVCVEKPDEVKDFFKGRVTDFITEKNYDPEKYDFYICGHPHMTDAVVKLLRKTGASGIYY